MRAALQRLDPVWHELFPGRAGARVVQLLVERVYVSPDGVELRLRTEGLANLTAELNAVQLEQSSIRKRGGRKVVLAPDGTPMGKQGLFCQQVDNAMVKAIARAFRWRNILESGEHSTIKELAGSENINQSYVARIFRLTLLAPDIVESIVEGRQPPEIFFACDDEAFPIRLAGPTSDLFGSQCEGVTFRSSVGSVGSHSFSRDCGNCCGA